MSAPTEPGSYVTERIGCAACLASVRRVIAAHECVTIETPDGSPIVAGTVTNDCIFDLQLRDPLEAAICHPVRIAVVRADSRHDAILLFEP